MNYTYFSHNGRLLPVEKAVVPLSNIEYSYGYGVYETIRVAGGVIYFLSEHSERLLESARIIGLEHSFDKAFVVSAVDSLVNQTNVPTYNLKLLLIGGATADKANLYITCLNPQFPDRKLYRTGASLITEHSERLYPQAKSLNMFTSYIAYRHAQEAVAYDALFINKAECITEGTRTNFFGLEDRTIVSPPANDCLAGVTRQNVIKVAKDIGFSVKERPMPLNEVGNYDSVFITSTPSKIMPVRSIDQHTWDRPISAGLDELMKAYDEFIDKYRAAYLKENGNVGA